MFFFSLGVVFASIIVTIIVVVFMFIMFVYIPMHTSEASVNNHTTPVHNPVHHHHKVPTNKNTAAEGDVEMH